ncbi:MULTISPECIES: hypothetical protein [unclassified Streptomyces]|uniref:hypothetical protein n=1 Tax=unclassified Streptomyces TaxID=2593676 RepID=UPI002DD85C87|nr:MULTISPECIES: hypothetical protein [unclassified Streptomyces]WSA95455.1 hypothetical protein OIE63_30760 [Streptomyces sp. NBC_01795]WSB79871.1 hypothetical protein OHB04_31865 [Streptomyces sp. NBC_01775]WSS11922.1 hypothetical protein OG533_08345 [Streptomyces sp. NBC_01186]WSS40636.1 hypothetical protein OG220_08505 [Streptomyces sp. NBC_01187]
MSGHALSKVTVNRPQPGTGSVDQDWRFAELTAQCYLDPTLAVRYAVEPHGVLAEFGIRTDEHTPIPALPADTGGELTITSLDPHDPVLVAPRLTGSQVCRVSDDPRDLAPVRRDTLR